MAKRLPFSLRKQRGQEPNGQPSFDDIDAIRQLSMKAEPSS
jgi:hypothetical protein